MSDNIIRTMTTSEEQLNTLFKEVLDGLRDDIEEAKENVLRYQEKIEIDPQTLDLYGQLLNSALTIKGSARDKQLKFLNTFKDRVTKKEAIDASKNDNKSDSMSIDISAMNEVIENMKKNKTVNMDLNDIISEEDDE